MISSIIRFECLIFMRSWAMRASLLLVFVMSFAGWGGSALQAMQTQAAQTDFLERTVRLETTFRERLVQLTTQEPASAYDGRPMLVRQNYTLNANALGDFAIGARAYTPNTVTISLWETSTSLFENYQFENPTLLAYGRFDLSIFVVLVMPLITIAMVFDLRAGDTRAGRSSLIRLAPISDKKWLLTRLSVRTALLWGPLIGVSLIALIINPLDAPWAERLTLYGLWLLLVGVYAVFWWAMSAVILQRVAQAGSTVSLLLLLWALLTMAAPAMAAFITEIGYEGPSRLQLLAETRAATSQADKNAEAWLERASVHITSNNSSDQGSPYRDGYARNQLVQSATAPLQHDFDTWLEQRQNRAAWLSWLSPTLAANKALDTVAGVDARRAVEFQTSARRHLERLALAIGPYVLAGERISLADYDQLPRMQTSAESTLLKRVFKLMLCVFMWTALWVSYVSLTQPKSYVRP